MFDLVIGISVCTHLSEQHQDQWLAELRRLCRLGGLVLLSVQGQSQSGVLYGRMLDSFVSLDQFGFVIKGVNPSINDLIGSRSYYLDVIQTRDTSTSIGVVISRCSSSSTASQRIQDLVVMRAGGVG